MMQSYSCLPRYDSTSSSSCDLRAVQSICASLNSFCRQMLQTPWASNSMVSYVSGSPQRAHRTRGSTGSCRLARLAGTAGCIVCGSCGTRILVTLVSLHRDLGSCSASSSGPERRRRNRSVQERGEVDVLAHLLSDELERAGISA